MTPHTVSWTEREKQLGAACESDLAPRCGVKCDALDNWPSCRGDPRGRPCACVEARLNDAHSYNCSSRCCNLARARSK
jgi:hypothetical protein